MNSVSLTSGISQISQQTLTEDVQAPVDRQWRAPPGTPVSHLSDLFASRNSLHQLEEFVKPTISKWYLLIPVHFKFIRDELIKRLNVRQLSGGSNERRLQRAAELLMEEQYNGELLERYRYSLIKA